MDARSLTHLIIKEQMAESLDAIEKVIKMPIVSYDGNIPFVIDETLLRCLELIKSRSEEQNQIGILLRTLGGLPEGAERMVDSIRYHFDKVTFIIDQYAMSAGTMISLSGNNIMMHYAATLGPIDPQVPNKDGTWVPATGYIHQYERILKTASERDLSTAEIIQLRSFDMASISLYESAILLASDLVTKWLEKYKFQGWKTPDERKERAKEIAKDLSAFKKWHSHARALGLNHLDALGIKIENYYKTMPNLHDLIQEYRNYADQTKGHILIFSKDLVASENFIKGEHNE